MHGQPHRIVSETPENPPVSNQDRGGDPPGSHVRTVRVATLMRFLVVGGLGTITNLAVFFVLVDLRQWHPTVGAVISFVVASAQNYFLNHYWTFARQVKGASASAGGYVRFMIVALTALGVNLLVLWAILLMFDPRWKAVAQAFAIGAATAVNYTGSRYWAFRAR